MLLPLPGSTTPASDHESRHEMGRSNAAPTTPPGAGADPAADTTDTTGTTGTAPSPPIRSDVTGFVTGGANSEPVDLASLVDDQGAATLVTLKENVYEEFTYPGSNRTGRRLLYHAGQTVSRAEIDARIASTRKQETKATQPAETK